jgi:septal ring factor EnvC (AmiA/AmiB activator)
MAAKWEDAWRTERDANTELQAEIARLRAEIERLRAALQEIADDPGGNPSESVVDEMREVARNALVRRTEPQ